MIVRVSMRRMMICTLPHHVSKPASPGSAFASSASTKSRSNEWKANRFSTHPWMIPSHFAIFGMR